MKSQFVDHIAAGDRLDDVFVLAEKTLAQKKNGENYLVVRLSDRTGTLNGVVWDDVARTSAAAEAGDFVRVQAGVSEYRGALQATVRRIEKCPSDTVDPADFLPSTTHDPDQMFDRLRAVTDSISHPAIHALIRAFWEDADLVAAFKRAPAAKKMHHAYLGGLLEHCLSMALLAEQMAKHYSGIDRSLLLAGIVLHDIGKVREFIYDTRIDYSDEGRLIGHIAIGLAMIDDKIRTIDDFPDELAARIKHLVVSHHGELAFGSPEPPKTIEALLLHYIDEIDSKVNGVREYMASQDPEQNWTAYHRLLGRHFYLGPIEEKKGAGD